MKLFAAAIVLSILCACTSSVTTVPDFRLDTSLKPELEKVARYRIFFGHQSVGEDIVRGLEDLKRTTDAGDFNVVHYGPGQALAGTFFAELKVGENQHPQTKLDEFSRLLDSGLGSKLDVALVKVCYVDFGRESDMSVDALFDAYLRTVKRMESTHPGLVVVPVTAPLQTSGQGARPVRVVKSALKSLLGREDDNDLRNDFNAKIRAAFADRPIFDLAAVESTYPDGSRETYGMRGTQALAPDYTTDGGHLNELGRKVAARELIRVLASLDVPKQLARSAHGVQP